MKLSHVSIQRPVFATVMSLTILLFGIISFTRLPVREYPDIDPPIIAKVNPNNLPVLWLTLSGAQPLYKISDFAEKEFKTDSPNLPKPVRSNLPSSPKIGSDGWKCSNKKIPRATPKSSGAKMRTGESIWCG